MLWPKSEYAVYDMLTTCSWAFDVSIQSFEWNVLVSKNWRIRKLIPTLLQKSHTICILIVETAASKVFIYICWIQTTKQFFVRAIFDSSWQHLQFHYHSSFCLSTTFALSHLLLISFNRCSLPWFSFRFWFFFNPIQNIQNVVVSCDHRCIVAAR